MNCLRCGRVVPEKVLLCPTCLAEKDLPVQAEREPLQEDVQKEQIRKLRKSRRSLRRLLALFVVLALAATGMLGAQWHFMRQQSSRIATQTSRINSLETAMEETRSELEQAKALNDTMAAALSDAQQKLDIYQAFTGLTPEEAADPSRVTE